MNTQPEALRLAEDLDAYHTAPHHKQAAAELRRLHSVNAELLKSLQDISTAKNRKRMSEIASAAITKAQE